LRSLSSLIKETRFSKRPDFYGLFGATVNILGTPPKVMNLKSYETALRKLDRELKKPEGLTGDLDKYYSTVIEGPNKLSKRTLRIEILEKLMRKTGR
jgi:hypothetical protein